MELSSWRARTKTTLIVLSPLFQVKIWFQNRRAKERKQVKKCDKLIAEEKFSHVATSLHHAAVSAAGAAAGMFGMPPPNAAAAAMGHMLHHSHLLP